MVREELDDEKERMNVRSAKLLARNFIALHFESYLECQY